MSESIISLRIIVFGKVQNVGFRYKAKEQADLLGLNGFVKNKMNGSVCIEVEGVGDLVREFERWCRKGPDWARVDKVVVHEQVRVNYNNFSIRS